MDSTKVLVIGIIILLLGGAAWFTLNGIQDDSAMEEGDTMMKEGDAIEEESAMMDTGDAMMQAGAYEDYSAEKVASAGDNKVLLFFHADWCPVCRPLDADIRAREGDIPANVTILKVNFDTEIALRQKYGVTVQHTIVQIDSKGTMVKKWSIENPKLSVLLTGVK